MEPFSLKLTIASLLFVIIVSASALWFISQIPEHPHIPAMKSRIDIPPANAALDPKIYSIPFCELIKNPERYDRKLVRMRAIFDNGVDWPHIKDDACPEDDAVVGAVGTIEANDKLVESKSPDKINPMIETLLRDGDPLEVNVDMVGRFYAGDKKTHGHQFAILYQIDVTPTGKRW